MLQLTESDGAITFGVRVVPRASRTEVAGEHDGALRVRVAAPPVEGAANEELTRFFAKSLGVAAREVEIVSGLASKSKRVRVRGASRAAVEALAAGARG
ncbi:MAG TPA: DUF167 domain-containing protein [Pyrinomonadaceae bacterium]|jgi:uncharacterized protein (TIGR00251 family)|nr:DUF167 domain-containing protein [Pyrinomonadaceae bacterium]